MATIRKKYQRKVNNLIRLMNANVANDELWRGRFECRQKDAFFERFEDGSGGVLHAYIRFYDKATNRALDKHFEYIGGSPFFESHLWMGMNDFIVEDMAVWEENPRPDIKTAKDYTNVRIPAEIMDMPTWGYNY